MRNSSKTRARVPSHIASLQNAKTKEEMIELVRKYLDEGRNSGPAVDGDEVFRELFAELDAKYKSKG
jgi:hypothetical protein